MGLKAKIMPLVEQAEREARDKELRANFFAIEKNDSMDEYIGESYCSSEDLTVVSEQNSLTNSSEEMSIDEG